MNNRDGILIIGGGVVGICTAFYLSERGSAVTVIDKSDIGSGSSYGNAGLIVPSHSVPLAAPGVMRQGLKWLLDPESPLYIQPRLNYDLARWLWYFMKACNSRQMQRAVTLLADLSLASLRLFDELTAVDGVDFSYERRGGLVLFNTQHGMEKGIEEAHLLQKHGVESHVLDANAVHHLEPGVKLAIVGGIHYLQDAHLIPDRFVREIARLAENRGVCLKTSTEVLGFTTTNRQISEVVTTRGTFRPGQVILAAGAWSPQVARDLKIRLPVQPAKGYSITVKRPAISPNIPLQFSESKVVLTPMGDTLRFAGTLELAGLNFSINRRRVEAIQRAVRTFLPDLPATELIEIWRGLRPLTPDTLPIIGRSSQIENLIFATGHGMLGVSLGPITAKLVSHIAARETPSIDMTLLRAERFP